MITNERQYKITKTQMAALADALRGFDMGTAVKRTGSPILATAEHEALESQVSELAEQVAEYEALQSGAVGTFRAHSLDELPSILIKARIASGLTQRQLAKALDIKEQQIQRYEADNYAAASLRRLTEVAQALSLEISEIAELRASRACQGATEGEGSTDWALFPVREMYRRGWFTDLFKGSIDEAVKNAEYVVREFIRSVSSERVPALLRCHVRAGSTMDKYALIAWQCRVLRLATGLPRKSPFA